MIRLLLHALVDRLRGWLKHRAASRAAVGPVDHADLKRMIEVARHGDERCGPGRLR